MSQDIVPTEEQARILLARIDNELLELHKEIAAGQERAYWGAGDLALRLQEEYYPEYSKSAIRKVVGEIYTISINTVRDRERICSAIPPQYREGFSHLFKFSHWRNIVPAGKEKAIDLIYEAQAMYEAHGKGPSVDQILAMRGAKGMDATPPWIYRLEQGWEKLEMIRDDPMAHPRIRQETRRYLERIKVVADSLKLERFLGEGEDKK